MREKSSIVKSSINRILTDKIPKSKGFGFIEFSSHSHALAALRYLNANPDAMNLMYKLKNLKEKKKINKSLIVEFAVENRLILRKRSDRVIFYYFKFYKYIFIILIILL